MLSGAAALAAACLVPCGASAQDAIALSLPVECRLGDTCYIQQFVDRDPSAGVRDYACGLLANDGHDGTDFAVPTLDDMERGVAVLAAAPGIVRGLRDGMPDISQDAEGAPDVTGVECGNGVLLDHGGGWQTQYCHLRQGSVRVATGDAVEAGTPLGLIGLSGQATFPHVHLSVRRAGAVVDPFAPDMTAPCNADTSASLWSDDVTYAPGGPIDAGLSDALPDFEDAKAGLPVDGLGTEADAVVMWVLMANVQEGDTLAFAIDGPSGRFAETTVTIARTQPLRLEAFGRRASQFGVPRGSYLGRVVHMRGNTVLGVLHAEGDLG